jgi:hypothetical protein
MVRARRSPGDYTGTAETFIERTRTVVMTWLTDLLKSAPFAFLPRRKTRESRKSPRTKLNAPVTVLTTGNQPYRGVCRDISLSGLGAIVYGDLCLGQSVRLKFGAIDGNEMNVPAVVRNLYGSRYGFELLAPVNAGPATRRQEQL